MQYVPKDVIMCLTNKTSANKIPKQFAQTTHRATGAERSNIMNKKEIIATLKELGVKFNSKATKEELEALLADAQASSNDEAVATENADAEGEKKDEKPAPQKVKYSAYTSKKNLLADFPAMDTENNLAKIFKNGFTYSITEDHKYVAVTYYFSKGAFYKYAAAELDDDMQVVDVKYADSIKEVKAGIKAIYFPQAEEVVA